MDSVHDLPPLDPSVLEGIESDMRDARVAAYGIGLDIWRNQLRAEAITRMTRDLGVPEEIATKHLLAFLPEGSLAQEQALEEIVFAQRYLDHAGETGRAAKILANPVSDDDET